MSYLTDKEIALHRIVDIIHSVGMMYARYAANQSNETPDLFEAAEKVFEEVQDFYYEWENDQK